MVSLVITSNRQLSPVSDRRDRLEPALETLKVDTKPRETVGSRQPIAALAGLETVLLETSDSDRILIRSKAHRRFGRQNRPIYSPLSEECVCCCHPLVGYIEFALRPQHETSQDSGIQIIKDLNYFKNKSRKRPRGLSMVSLNSSDWDEYWNNNASQDDLRTKRIKLEQADN